MEIIRNNLDNIIDTYADMVYRIALIQMKNRDDAQDVFQEVFFRLVKNIDKIENEEHLKYWLIRVTINCSKTSIKNILKNKTLPIEENIYLGKSFENSTEYLELFEKINKLPKKYSTVIFLFYYEELSVKEISSITKQKESTVKSQLSRARTMLKDMLSGERSAL